MSRRTSILLLGCALAAAIAAFVTQRRSTPTQRSTDAATTAAKHKAADEKRLADVESIVAQRNRRAKQDEQAFVADGWTIVKTDPPDPRVTTFDPSLIAAGREAELRHQLASTLARPEDARRIARIALDAVDESTRFAAIDALGHIRGADDGQLALLELLTGEKLEPEDFIRRQIAPLLRPRDLDDPIAQRMAVLLDDPRLTAVEKKQIAFTLALLSLRDGMPLPDATLASLSADARAHLDDMRAVAQRKLNLHSRKEQ